MRKALALGTAAASMAVLGLAAPASAADSATTLTVNLSGGSLSISAPAAASMSGSASAGSVLTGSLGTTRVTDNRGTLAGWTVSAVTGGNLVSAADPSKSIALTAAGPLVSTVATADLATVGTSVLTGLSGGATVAVGAGGGLNATTPSVLVTATSLAGGGSFDYTPSLTLTVPPNTYAASDYTVVVTQSVV